MQIKAKDVNTYIEEAPAERREALTRLRNLCRTILTGFEETMDYGGPSYKRNGEVEVGFASQKHFIGLNILRTDVMNVHKDRLKGKGVSVGKVPSAIPGWSGSILRWLRVYYEGQWYPRGGFVNYKYALPPSLAPGVIVNFQ